MNDNLHRIRLDAQWVIKPAVRFSMDGAANSVDGMDLAEPAADQPIERAAAQTFERDLAQTLERDLAIQSCQWREPMKLKHLKDWPALSSKLDQKPARVLMERFFNCPTGLQTANTKEENDERENNSSVQTVVLEFAIARHASVWLNGEWLNGEWRLMSESSCDQGRMRVCVDVRQRLLKRNLLQVFSGWGTAIMVENASFAEATERNAIDQFGFSPIAEVTLGIG